MKKNLAKFIGFFLSLSSLVVISSYASNITKEVLGIREELMSKLDEEDRQKLKDSDISIERLESILEKKLSFYVPRYRDYRITDLSKKAANRVNQMIGNKDFDSECNPIFSYMLESLKTGNLKFYQDLNFDNIDDNGTGYISCKFAGYMGDVPAKIILFPKGIVMSCVGNNLNTWYTVAVSEHMLSSSFSYYS